MHVTAAEAIHHSPTLAGREALLAEIAAGEKLATLAFSERGSRSQFWAPVSGLEPNGTGYTTSAHKSWVTSASHADLFVSSAQAPEAASPLESTLYLYRKGDPGVRVEGTFNGLGLRGNDSGPMTLEEIQVAEGALLTEPGAGAAAMLEVVLPWFAVGSAAMANGICRAAVSATTGHLSTSGFAHDGRRLRDLPNLRARLAEMSARTAQSRALLEATTARMEAPDAETPLFVLQSRLAALTAALEVTDLAMKTCGGAAFSRHLALERYFRDARAGWVMAPTVDHLHDFIGRALTGLPLFEAPASQGNGHA
jgi:alkylation response protein AidB-like acyl-CoA dehydrogenase